MATAVQHLTTALKLLSDPTRLRLCGLLAQRELAVQELVSVTGLQQSRISNHLALLKRAGLVRDRREGTWSFHSLVEPGERGPLTPELFAAVVAPWQGSDDGRRDQLALRAVLEHRREKSRQAHDRLAERWERGQEFAHGSLRAEVLAQAWPQGLVVADLGCGTGFLATRLAAAGARVIAVDHSERMLAAARRKKTAGAIEFRRGELDALPIDDQSVDAAFANLVFHHLPDFAAAAAEVFRILKPGGTVVISDLLPHDADWMRQTMGDLRLGLKAEQVSAALARAGFVELRSEPAVDRCRVHDPAGAPVEFPMFLVRGERPRARSTSRSPRSS
jgi:ArsR family transcriptional regulator